MAEARPVRAGGPVRTVQDITDAFNQATSNLQACELVKNPKFTLFEAVSAVEIMDPKMDSGFLASGDSTEDDYDVAQELEPAQVVGIIDQLLSLEAAWHMGHGLSQTLLTSIYLDRLLWPVSRSLNECRFDRLTGDKGVTGLVAVVLRAYCLSLIKACHLVIFHITRQYYYEEEDFVTQLHNRNFLSNVQTDQVIEAVDHSLVWLENEKDKGTVSADIAGALCQRLLFRKSFLLSLDTSQSGDGQPCDATFYSLSLQCLQRIQQANSSTPREGAAGMPVVSIPVQRAFSPKILRRLGTSLPPRPPVDDISVSTALDYLTAIFRDAADSHELLNCASPHDLLNAVCTFNQRRKPSLFVRCLIQSFLQNENPPDSFDAPLAGSEQVSRDSEYRNSTEFFVDSLTELVLPDSILLDTRNEVTENPNDPKYAMLMFVKGYIETYTWTFSDLYRFTCMNRSRVRRMLTHSIISWDAMQLEAENLDKQLQVLNNESPRLMPGTSPPRVSFYYPLGSWAYHHKLQQLRHIVQMGFELDIYTLEEFGPMYYYLSYICATHLSHLDRINYFVTSQQSAKYATGCLSTHTRNQRFAHTLSVLQRSRIEIAAIHQLALALHALYVLLDRHGLVPHPRQNEKSCPQRRYELRMKPFQNIHYEFPMRNIKPKLADYETWARETALNDVQDNWSLLERSKSAVDQSRESWKELKCLGLYTKVGTAQKPGQTSLEKDWVQDVSASLRACIGTSLAINAVESAMKQKNSPKTHVGKGQKKNQTGKEGTQDSNLNIGISVPGIDDKGRFHPFWAVPTITASQNES